MRVIMTSGIGIRADISYLCEDLLRMAEYADFQSEMSTRRIMALGHKLTAAGGLLAPAAVLVALEPFMVRKFADHVATVWKLNDIDETEIDQDDIPAISVAGAPPAPTRRGREAGRRWA